MKDNKNVDQDEFLVVGIGASAGGLEALKLFFGSLPEKTGMAFIVAVHLSPDHKSSMPELLQHHTALEVLQVTGKTEIKADCVYVIPPKKNLLVKDNHIELSELDSSEHPPHVVDQLYRSLGKAKGNKAVCITLSGTGKDGVLGIKAIKEEGGLIIVQDPGEAQYGGMPQSAIDTGLADKILAINRMPQALMDYRENLSAVRISSQPDELSEEEQEVLYDILEKVRKDTDHDFQQYKTTTVLRRIERRMHVHNVQSLSEYLGILDTQDDESKELFKDLLISVTHFFRDREAFKALKQKVIPELFKGMDPDEELRVWVPGCATGEEAYSIAMLLREHAENIDQPPEIKIFATDIDEQALQTGRAGRYPESIADDVTPERLQRFFTKDNHEYQVKEELRAMILFSPHDLLKNPPFSNLDLISCRNLLIYLNNELQSQVFNLFHYSLTPGGYLWLGSSGSNLKATEQFKAVANKYKIYQKRTSYTKRSLQDIPLQFNKNRPFNTRSRQKPSKDRVNIKELHQQLITQQYGPPSVLINENEEVLHSTAGMQTYLNYPEGKPSQNIFDMIIPELRHPLRNMFYQAKKEETDLPICKQVPAVLNGESHMIEINLHRVKEQGSPNDLMCIVFRKIREIEPLDVSEPVKREDVPEEGRKI
ncbi:Methylase of chemotaxis methyl-accepting proteins [Fodinibius roseus]|uniref:Methylase of chemotaxis methyl-accepting proteins n=1 Tax=Fodinibius roseus TaxID=1194090 RepID=A0A1M5G5G0_9BACT|nr:CheR family methyltransferase [Fodinibius roseus]SHF98662.1 Methylase of chemotaxis methyl-accepting proteins [Fodinibius roseus]